jgi:hypothetical protein
MTTHLYRVCIAGYQYGSECLASSFEEALATHSPLVIKDHGFEPDLWDLQVYHAGEWMRQDEFKGHVAGLFFGKAA